MGVGPWLGGAARDGGRGGRGGDQRGQQIMLRVSPRSTWRRTTRCTPVAAVIMASSLRAWTLVPQTRIPRNETVFQSVRRAEESGAGGDVAGRGEHRRGVGDRAGAAYQV